jgi:hypothetical protein
VRSTQHALDVHRVTRHAGPGDESRTQPRGIRRGEPVDSATVTASRRKSVLLSLQPTLAILDETS